MQATYCYQRNIFQLFTLLRILQQFFSILLKVLKLRSCAGAHNHGVYELFEVSLGTGSRYVHAWESGSRQNVLSYPRL